MNSMQLMCFVEVAATLSFSKAAGNLHVSQPTVSHQIRSLEEELGCTLLVRSTRTVSLTDEGLLFLGYAHDLLELGSRAKRAVVSEEAPGAKRLRIGVSDGVEAQMISPALGRVYRGDRAFDPVLRLGPHSVLVEMLESGSLDVVLEYRDPAGAPAAATVFRRLFEAPAALVRAVDYGGAGEGAGETAIERVAFCNPQTTPAAIAAMQRSLMARTNPARPLMCPNIEALLSLVSAGIAVAALPNVPAMHRAELAFEPLEEVDPVVVGVRVRRGRLERTLDAFIHILTEELQHEPRGLRAS